MKTLILLLSLFCLPAFANFISLSDFNSCLTGGVHTVFVRQDICESQKSEQCVQMQYMSSCKQYDVVDELVDDLDKKIWSAEKDEETCDGASECQELLASKVCSVDHQPFIDELYTKVYCVQFLGYEKKLTGRKILQTNPDKLASFQAEELARKRLEAAKAVARSLRECGEGVMDLMLVRNQSKHLTVPQVAQLLQTYQPIQLQLSSGSLLTAKTAIQAVSPDGVVVTEADKFALIQEIDKCLGL